MEETPDMKTAGLALGIPPEEHLKDCKIAVEIAKKEQPHFNDVLDIMKCDIPEIRKVAMAHLVGYYKCGLTD